MKINFFKSSIQHIKQISFKKEGYSRNLKGFTLVESLMAILILTTSIIAPLALALQTLKYTTIATEKIEATYMAEEAVEIVHHLKKSAEVYCSDPEAPTDVCTEYFIGYFLDQTSPLDNVIDSKCFGFSSPGVKKYCNFDVGNIIYSSDKKTKLKGVNSDFVYLVKNNNSLSSATNIVNNFKRSVSIIPVDNNSNGTSYLNPNSILITSIVCTRESGTCDENSANKVMIQSLIAR